MEQSQRDGWVNRELYNRSMNGTFMTTECSCPFREGKINDPGKKGPICSSQVLGRERLAFDKSTNSLSTGIDRSQDVGPRPAGTQTRAALVHPTLLVKYEAKSEGEGGVGGLSRKKKTKQWADSTIISSAGYNQLLHPTTEFLISFLELLFHCFNLFRSFFNLVLCSFFTLSSFSFYLNTLNMILNYV